LNVWVLFTFVAVVLLLGGVTGWLMGGKKDNPAAFTGQAGETKSTQKEAGVDDQSLYKDSAQGVLEKGGIEGDGTHHLVREGGPSKYVYLNSTVIDLSVFEGKKVEVWGETTSSENAPWFMDVGRVKVAE